MEFVRLCIDISASIYRAIFHTITSHFIALYRQSCPVKREFDQNRVSKYHFYFPLCIIIFSFLYGVFGLHYESCNEIFNANLSSSPFIFTHQIAPKSIWSATTQLIILNTVGSTCLYVAQIVTAPVQNQFRICNCGYGKFSIASKLLSNDISKQISKFEDKVRIGLHIGALSFICWVTIYYLINVYVNSVYIFNWRFAAFWIVFFPLFTFYTKTAFMYSSIFVILSSRYIGFRQQECIQKLSIINQQMATVGKKRATTKVTRYWSRLVSANGHSVEICRMIDEYSRFCIPKLSVLYPFCITVQCFLIYIDFFTSVPLLPKVLLFTGIAYCNAFLFIITHECAQIVKYNQQIERLNRDIYLNAFKLEFKYNFKLWQNWQWGKLQSFQTSRRLRSYAFRLFDNYRITSKTFYVIMSGISTSFMFLFKRQFY